MSGEAFWFFIVLVVIGLVMWCDRIYKKRAKKYEFREGSKVLFFPS